MLTIKDPVMFRADDISRFRRARFDPVFSKKSEVHIVNVIRRSGIRVAILDLFISSLLLLFF
jgi:hypothetical protein